MKRLTPHLLILVALLVMTACSNRVRMDDVASYAMYPHADEPLRFIASRPRLSVVGKDYLLMAPVTVSSTGQSQTYLWFALGSTVDRPITGAPEPTFSSIVIDLDGLLMTFHIIPWANAARADPFEVSVRTHASYGTKVTSSQLARIASATEIRAYVTNAQDRSPVYEFSKRGRPLRPLW